MKRILLAALLLLTPAAAQFNGCTTGFCTGSAGFDTSAVAWQAAVIAASGTVSATQLARVSNLIACYKTNSIWSIRDRTWLRASENTTQANLDIVNLQTSTPHGTITFTAGQGYTSNGTTGYIDTGYIPSTAGGNLTLNSATIGAYIITNDTSVNNRVLMGVNSGGSDFLYLQPLAAGGSFWENNGITFPTVAGQASSQGFWLNSRVNAITITLDKNGAQIGSASSNSGSLATKSIFVGAFDDNGTADNFSTDQWALDFIAGGLTPTQRAAESTCDNAYMASLSINVYVSAGNPAAVQSTNLASIFSGHASSTLPVWGISSHLNTAIDAVLASQVWSGGTVTATAVNPLGIANGTVFSVNIDSVTPSGYDGAYTATITSATTFTYAASNSGTITAPGGFNINIPPATNAALASALGVSLFRSDLTWQTSDPSGSGTASFAWFDATATAIQGVGIGLELILDYGNSVLTGSFFTGPATLSQRTAYNLFGTQAATHAKTAWTATPVRWSIWNEANIGCGTGYAWAPNANASDYSAATAPIAAAINVVTAASKIITGGFAPTGCGIAPNTFITSFIAAGAQPNLTGYGFHPYNSTIPEQAITDTASFVSAASNTLPVGWDEIGYTTPGVGSESIKGAFISRLVTSGIVSQVTQVNIYDLIDDGSDPTDGQSNYGMYPFTCAASLTGCTALAAGTALKNTISPMAGCTGGIDAAQYVLQNFWEITCHVSGGVRRVVWSSATTFVFVSTESSITAASAMDTSGASIPVTVSGNSAKFLVQGNGYPVVLSVTN